jgi:hypothetical protein
MLQHTLPTFTAILRPVYPLISMQVGCAVSMKSVKSFVIHDRPATLHPLPMSKREESLSPIGHVHSSLVVLVIGTVPGEASELQPYVPALKAWCYFVLSGRQEVGKSLLLVSLAPWLSHHIGLRG